MVVGAPSLVSVGVACQGRDGIAGIGGGAREQPELVAVFRASAAAEGVTTGEESPIVDRRGKWTVHCSIGIQSSLPGHLQLSLQAAVLGHLGAGKAEDLHLASQSE